MLPHEFAREHAAGRRPRARYRAESDQHRWSASARTNWQPMVLDFGTQPHLMAFADVECGKTTLLRNIAMGIVENSTPEQARIILVDYRRTMLGVVEGEQLAGYSTSSQTCDPMIEGRRRLPGRTDPGLRYHPAAAARAQLVERAGDVYPRRRLRHGGAGIEQPADPADGYLPQARDIGLHLIITRRTGGVSRHCSIRCWAV